MIFVFIWIQRHIFVIVIVFLIIKLWMRRLYNKKKRKAWEVKEREKAKIWKEEYKNK